jgi:hypothetical protein
MVFNSLFPTFICGKAICIFEKNIYLEYCIPNMMQYSLQTAFLKTIWYNKIRKTCFDLFVYNQHLQWIVLRLKDEPCPHIPVLLRPRFFEVMTCSFLNRPQGLEIDGHGFDRVKARFLICNLNLIYRVNIYIYNIIVHRIWAILQSDWLNYSPYISLSRFSTSVILRNLIILSKIQWFQIKIHKKTNYWPPPPK